MAVAIEVLVPQEGVASIHEHTVLMNADALDSRLERSAETGFVAALVVVVARVVGFLGPNALSVSLAFSAAGR